MKINTFRDKKPFFIYEFTSRDLGLLELALPAVKKRDSISATEAPRSAADRERRACIFHDGAFNPEGATAERQSVTNKRIFEYVYGVDQLHSVENLKRQRRGG